MSIEHRPPTTATIKQLYAHAYRCAHTGCPKPLFRVDDNTGERTLNSLICHIHARSEGGPRWLATQSEQENRSVGNLVLMCREHAAMIDNPLLLSNYTPERLQSFKIEQVAEYDRLTQGGRSTAIRLGKSRMPHFRTSASRSAIQRFNSAARVVKLRGLAAAAAVLWGAARFGRWWPGRQFSR